MDEHNKQNTGGEQKKLELVSYFDNDASFVFAYKKTEKLASAVYMVTNLFPENEPMRLGLRRRSQTFCLLLFLTKMLGHPTCLISSTRLSLEFWR